MSIRPAGPVRVAICGLATALLAMWVRSPVAATAATSSQPFTLTASAMQVTGFSYIGVVTIGSGTGPVDVLEFVMSTASLSALDVVAPCAGTTAVETVVGPTSAAQTSGGMTLDVTSLQATIDGVAVSYTVSNPPASQPLPTGSGTLSSVTAVAMVLAAPSLSMASMTTRIIACPLAAPPVASPKTPLPMPTPSPSLSPAPIQWPTPSPTPTPIQWPAPTPSPTVVVWPTPTPSTTS